MKNLLFAIIFTPLFSFGQSLDSTGYIYAQITETQAGSTVSLCAEQSTNPCENASIEIKGSIDFLNQAFAKGWRVIHVYAPTAIPAKKVTMIYSYLLFRAPE